jgi:hypothetical protein
MRKPTCEGCGKEVWIGQDLCFECELELKERRFDEKNPEYNGGSVTPNKGKMK